MIGPKLEVNFKEVPLWEAIRKLQDGIQDAGTVEWRNDPAPMGSAVGEPFSNAGAFVLRVANVVHNADYGHPEPELFYASVLPMSDLSTRIVGIGQGSKPSLALDDAGNSLVPSVETPITWEMVAERNGGGKPAAFSRVSLQRPLKAERGGRVIKRLEGELPLLIATKIETIRMAYGATEQRTYPGVSAEIKFASMNALPTPRAELSVSFQRTGAMSDEEWTRLAVALADTRIRQVTANGTEQTTTTGGENTNTERRTGSVIYGVPAAGDTTEYRVEIPAEWREIRVPYRFENVPLP